MLDGLASHELHRRIRSLEDDMERISAMLGKRMTALCQSDLFSEMALLVEDVDRLRAEIARRAGARNEVVTPSHVS
jgi:uncharacterized small protein (DUF1192 family)